MGLVSEQSLYNLTARTVELEVIPALRHYGVGLILWSPIQKRVEELRPQLEAYEAFCDELGEQPADVALWLLHQPAVTAAIIGPRTRDQLTAAQRALRSTWPTTRFGGLTGFGPAPAAKRPRPTPGDPDKHHDPRSKETTMRGAVLYAPGDVRLEARDDPKILGPTDAIIRLSATCVCGSDLWPYRGIDPVEGPAPMGHEYAGIVEEVGSAVTTIRPGQFVIGSFFASDGTCEICRAGYQSSCVHREPVGASGTQAEYARIPLADGTLVATPDLPPEDLIPSCLAASDVLGTGWFGAVAAEAGPGKTVAVVGDGAVGLLGVLAARQLGAERIIAMSRHAPRQNLALEFGATDIMEERGDEGVAMIKELTGGLGAHSVIEAVGTQESMMQAIRSTRPGGHVGFVGVLHDVEIPGGEYFYSHVHLHGGPAPVRRLLPQLVDLIWNREIDPGKVFDLALPLEDVAEGYRAMDERRAIKALLWP